MNDTGTTRDDWLLLVHQLPAKPAYLRVKVWRRLQALGAVPIKNAVHVLPCTEEAREDFAWLIREILEGGGEATLCEACFIDGLSDADVRGLFDRARDEDYATIAAEARVLLEGVRADAAKMDEARAGAVRLRARLNQVAAIDFFGAHGRAAASGVLDVLETTTRGRNDMPAKEPVQTPLDTYKGLRWITRQGIHVDRIATAWLVRRFIDGGAVFTFVPSRSADAVPGAVRFDMVDGEVTHEGDRCTFEVLLGRVGLADPALQAIAEIIHDIDLKDGKFGRAEADGIRVLIAGICMGTKDDEERLARGMAVFDDLLGFFRKKGS
ncbi:chromate resistance protein ChrB domain-containing protein [Nitrospirillum sp. BR 11163]|uniref:chromate resistance protein ChrB domain-containing protein n=1 Tax=Nitrospirillum sp. BR 11163 TaxID=3104323 RepID=UPI002AFE50AA|nr:chromate resistance protein ChrB domain-containing protein [Nitrospirillum sp. BR 11163]MEA1672005.1 chromate resistance protein [Nitrospirillum sp. BR 11163]